MNSYLFKYEPEKTILAFTTLGGHISGTLMKNLNFVAPAKIKRMRERVEEIGQCILVDNVMFVVLRKHYNTKVSHDQFKMALNNLPKDRLYKTTKEDFITQWNSVPVADYGIEIYESSQWGDQDWM